MKRKKGDEFIMKKRIRKREIIKRLWNIRDRIISDKGNVETSNIYNIDKTLEELDNLLQNLPYKDKWFKVKINPEKN